jgi:hypothetical protein
LLIAAQGNAETNWRASCDRPQARPSSRRWPWSRWPRKPWFVLAPREEKRIRRPATLGLTLTDFTLDLPMNSQHSFSIPRHVHGGRTTVRSVLPTTNRGQ